MDDSKKTDRIEMLSGKKLIKQSFRDIEDVYCYKNKVYSIPTFSHGLDLLTVGWHKSDVIVIAGRPGTGKSAFVHNIVNYTAMQEVPVLLCSPEMRKEMIALRLLSMDSNVAFNAIERGALAVVDWPVLTTAAGKLSEEILNIDDTLPLPLAKIIKIANELKTDNKLEILVIDSLPFISTEANESEDAIASIMMSLKSLARDLNIPVLLTVPLKAESMQSSKQYLCLNDIENDYIVNYSDVIIFLHKVTSPNKKKGQVEALIAKNRNGELGLVPFHFFYQCLRFEDYSAGELASLEMH